MGAAPRYAGSSDGWTFRRREGEKSLSIEAGRMRPKDAVISTCDDGGLDVEASEKGGGSCGNSEVRQQMRLVA